MKEVIYKSTTRLNCECDCTEAFDVIVCLPAALVASGFKFIEASVSECSRECSTGFFIYNYTISYDESLLANPTYNLINSDITGVLCQGCLTDWVKDYVASILQEPS